APVTNRGRTLRGSLRPHDGPRLAMLQTRDRSDGPSFHTVSKDRDDENAERGYFFAFSSRSFAFFCPITVTSFMSRVAWYFFSSSAISASSSAIGDASPVLLLPSPAPPPSSAFDRTMWGFASRNSFT